MGVCGLKANDRTFLVVFYSNYAVQIQWAYIFAFAFVSHMDQQWVRHFSRMSEGSDSLITVRIFLKIIFTARKRSLRRLCFYPCLSFCSQGGGVCMAGSHVWPGGMHGGGHAWQAGVHGGGHVWLGGMHDRGHAWWGGGHVWQVEHAFQRGHAWQGACMAGGAWQGASMPRMPRMSPWQYEIHSVNAGVVRILLECIPVWSIILFIIIFTVLKQQTWKYDQLLATKQWRIYLVQFWMHPSPRGPNSFNFMQFLGNFGKIVCWHPPWRVGAPSSGKSWIRHCQSCEYQSHPSIHGENSNITQISLIWNVIVQYFLKINSILYFSMLQNGKKQQNTLS